MNPLTPLQQEEHDHQVNAGAEPPPPPSTLHPPPSTDKPVKGLSLLSGGLDSMLAISVLRAQGIHVEGIVFSSPFFTTEAAERAAKMLGVKLHIVDFTGDILTLIHHPPHGFGGALNPCIDCHATMIRRAGELMQREGFDFVATGEVLNQRPMSQNRRSLETVAKDSGIPGRLLRPLSAKLLPPTRPEEEGLVDREQLLALEGRNRKPQIALAQSFGYTAWPSPAGGCLLTEKGFCNKLKDLLDHNQCTCGADADRLKIGRHFRLPGGAKVIVGRDRSDNQTLKTLPRPGDTLVHTASVPGPTALILGPADSDDLLRVMGICAAYGDSAGRDTVTVKTHRDGATQEHTIAPLPRETFMAWML